MNQTARLSTVVLIALLSTNFAYCADWPQWGRTSEKNNAAGPGKLPTKWEVGEFERKTGRWLDDSAENMLWVQRIGSQSYGTPVVAGENVFCAGNNGAGRVKDLGCLFCFDRKSGEFRWQLSREKLKEGSEVDWAMQGICSVPLVEGKTLWVVTNRGEVACLDTEGFHDGKNNGPYTDEPSTEKNEADVIWYFDMMKQLGVHQHNMASCSVTALGDLLFVCTSNGADDDGEIAAPEAPSFIALNKKTGQLVWADASPGENILHGQWGSPAVAVIDDAAQVIFPGGDGWLYSFLAKPTDDKKPKLLWKFDCNPKDTVWEGHGQGERNNIIATPVVYDGLVYIATGQDPEHGEGQGRLWCVDPRKRGDVSSQLVVDKDGKPVPPQRTKGFDPDKGQEVVDNPNSAVVWQYIGHDADGDGELSFKEKLYRSMSMVAIGAKGDEPPVLVLPDLSGFVRCLDAKTGKFHWSYDMMSAVWGSPLLADGKIYIGNEDGDIVVFDLSPKMKKLATNYMGDSIYGSAVAVNGIIYAATRTRVMAIGEEK